MATDIIEVTPHDATAEIVRHTQQNDHRPADVVRQSNANLRLLYANQKIRVRLHWRRCLRMQRISKHQGLSVSLSLKPRRGLNTRGRNRCDSERRVWEAGQDFCGICRVRFWKREHEWLQFGRLFGYCICA